MNYWSGFNRYLCKYWKLQAAAVLLGVLALPLSLINPYLAKLVIDRAYGNSDLRLFFILAGISAGIFVFNSLLNCLSNYIAQRIKCGVRFDMTKDVFRRLQNMPLSFFNNSSTGEHVYKISSDVSVVCDFITKLGAEIFILLPRIIFILAIVFYLNWKLALLAFLLLPLGLIHPYFFGKKLKIITQIIINFSQGVFERLHEAFSHMHLVKALGKEKYEIDRFEKAIAAQNDAQLKYARLFNIGNYSGAILNKAIGGVIALFGGYLVITQAITLGSLTAIMIYLTQLMGLVKSAAKLYESSIVNSVSRGRLNEILDARVNIQDAAVLEDLTIIAGKIEFKDVCFGYEKDNYVLNNLNLRIEPAAKIALVGPSGCGKTTLLNLILKLYDAQKGAIFVGGEDIKEIPPLSLRGQIGVALQEPFLFNDTIADNILYGAESASREDLIKAAQIAQIHGFIDTLPKKYDSMIGEMACRLSEGQRQRIALARAMIRGPKILILDEALSSVDSETEEKIIDKIKMDFKDATLIVVSHRLSIVEKMDAVYFLQAPDKIEISTHAGLLANNKRYAELFTGQLKAKEEKGILSGVK
ncbi:MAG: ABC transporter ATP-binding protein [Candidatus Omnitrophica bacterium]|nr:ABC transporter ATP-binding protein [Candidatus Omnitrophota bacterium]